MKRRFWIFIIAFALLILALLGWTVEAMRWATTGRVSGAPSSPRRRARRRREAGLMTRRDRGGGVRCWLQPRRSDIDLAPRGAARGAPAREADRARVPRERTRASPRPARPVRPLSVGGGALPPPTPPRARWPSRSAGRLRRRPRPPRRSPPSRATGSGVPTTPLRSRARRAPARARRGSSRGSILSFFAAAARVKRRTPRRTWPGGNRRRPARPRARRPRPLSLPSRKPRRSPQASADARLCDPREAHAPGRQAPWARPGPAAVGVPVTHTCTARHSSGGHAPGWSTVW